MRGSAANLVSGRVMRTAARSAARGALAGSFALTTACGSTLGAQIPFAAVDDSSRAAPPADQRIPYGASATQFIELRVPRTGRQAHPVVMLMHGGCWRAAYSLSHVAAAAEALRAAGYATWRSWHV
jgi:acetyl esterase/lipase